MKPHNLSEFSVFCRGNPPVVAPRGLTASLARLASLAARPAGIHYSQRKTCPIIHDIPYKIIKPDTGPLMRFMEGIRKVTSGQYPAISIISNQRPKVNPVELLLIAGNAVAFPSCHCEEPLLDGGGEAISIYAELRELHER